jgi:DNA-binding HxlR family transcriptional regulator
VPALRARRRPRKAVRRTRRSDCPVAIALEIWGDRWSLLVIRDLLIKELRTFKEFLASGEGIATNILTDRLRRLEAEGLVAHRPAPDRRGIVYRLTPKGMDLAPVLVEVILWAARHEQTAAPAATIRRIKEDRDRFIAELRARCTSAGRG